MHRTLLATCCFLTMFSFLSAKPLDVGAPAPAITATTDADAALDFNALYSQQPYTLVYFYPKADTPGCTKQGCSLRDAYEELTDRGVAIVGVSTDNAAAQRAFKEKYNLPFTLVADTDKSVMKAFGVPGLKFASRQAYLIHDGKIVYADHEGSTTEQADDILAFLGPAQG